VLVNSDLDYKSFTDWMDDGNKDNSFSKRSFQINLLMELVEDCQKISPTCKTSDAGPASFEEIDKMLTIILGGTVTQTEAEKFLTVIKSSKETFDKVCLKLKHLAPLPNKEADNLMPDIMMHDEQIKSFLSERSQPQVYRNNAGILFDKFLSFLESARDFVFNIKPVPGFAMAAVVLFMVVMGTLTFTSGVNNPVYNSLFRAGDPYYHASELLRSGETGPLNKNEIPFIANLNIAMGEYLTGDFENALKIIQNLQDSMITSNRISVEKNPELFSETSFCRGMAYLAFAQSKNRWQYKDQLLSARTWFLKARFYSQDTSAESEQRILFFEGLTLYLLGDFQNARDLLVKVQDSQEFKSQTLQLLSAMKTKL
jgi:hypothetical protein